MKRKMILSRRYASALQEYLKKGPRANLRPALGLGRQAVAIGLETLDMARIHEGALSTLKTSGSKNTLVKRAEIFLLRPLRRSRRLMAPPLKPMPRCRK